jgi:hypothetical protein
MRPFLRRFRWPIAGVIAIGLVAVLLAASLGRTRRIERAPWPPAPTPSSRLAAYRGVGSWVDIFDAKAWRDPAGVVADMAGHGVTTLYLETATARSRSGLTNPSAMSTFITEAHAHHMYVVAWYPPSMRSGSNDFDRIVQAVEFTTADGEKFDSVALDIESTAVKPVSLRNRRLATLSRQVRARVGASYPLGAIIPSPVDLRKQTGFWNVFPYESLASSYDVFLPMNYYSYHVHGSAAVYAETVANMHVLRKQPGCKTIPVHMIGGLAGDTSSAEVSRFSQAARKTGCIGVSLYDWVGTSPAQWVKLTAVW